MPAKMIERVVADLRTWSAAGSPQTGDEALLDAYLARKDDTAFAAIVQRHGPMALGVCRRILGHAQDSEDAFQAVFWVLARKAATIRPRAWLGNWLYGVAVRTALKARGLRQRRREKQVTVMPSQSILSTESAADVHAVLDEEIERLPVKYRTAVVLCELEGRSRTEAAQQLGIPEGTLSSRLAQARRLLAKRLKGRGVTGSLVAASGWLAEQAASAAVPPALMVSTIQSAHTAGVASAAVTALAKGVLSAMFMTKLKNTVALTLAGVLVVGLGFAWRQQPSDAGMPVVRADAGLAQPAPVLREAPAAQREDAQPKADGLMGLWRILEISVRLAAEGGEGAAGPGGVPPGFGGRPGSGFAPPGPRGPMGAGPRGPGMPGGEGPGAPGTGTNVTSFDGSNNRAFLDIAADRALFIHSGSQIAYHLVLGPGTIEMTMVDTGEKVPGTYAIENGVLRLFLGGDKARPKNAKEARETWVLMRQPSRQEFYQRLDQLQGHWKAVSGEFNGESFLPRELAMVILSIDGDRWLMNPPNQPGQPDAVPQSYFNKALSFVLDADGPRTVLVFRSGVGNRLGETRVLYELRGDTLKVCWRVRGQGFRDGGGDEPQLPREFKTSAGSDRVLFVLRREGSHPGLGGGAPGEGGGLSVGPGGLPSVPVGPGGPAGPTIEGNSSHKFQFRINGPTGMKVRVLNAKADKSVPARITFDRPGTFRLKVHEVPGRPGKEYYPTFEIVAPTSPDTTAFLENAYVSVEWAEADFVRADEGALVTRWYHLPEGAGADRVVIATTREAVPAKGLLLAIVRLGGIDLGLSESREK